MLFFFLFIWRKVQLGNIDWYLDINRRIGGEGVLSIKTCDYWFWYAKLDELFDKDVCQIQEGLAKTLGVIQEACLKAMDMVQKKIQRSARMLLERSVKAVDNANDGLE